jgi:hypothetical protein
MENFTVSIFTFRRASIKFYEMKFCKMKFHEMKLLQMTKEIYHFDWNVTTVTVSDQTFLSL